MPTAARREVLNSPHGRFRPAPGLAARGATTRCRCGSPAFRKDASMQLLAFIGPMEMLIVGIVVLLLFGSRLPSVARSIGKSVTEFKKGVNGIEDDSPDGRKLER